MASGLKIAKAREGYLPTLRAGFRRVQGQTVERCGLDTLYLSKHFVGSDEIARTDRVLGLRLKGGHLRIITGLSCGCCLQLLEALGNLDQLRGELLRRDILLTQNVERRPELALVEVQLLLEGRN